MTIKSFLASFTRRAQHKTAQLPDYGLLYFDNLYGQYRSLLKAALCGEK